MAPAKCSFMKENGKSCRCIALKNSDMCRHHQVPGEPEIIYGKMDSRGEGEPHNKPEFWDNYSKEEIYTYVLNDTGGRVHLDRSMDHEGMVQAAIEVVS